MNNEELLAMALAGIAVWMLLVSRRANATPASPAVIYGSNTGFVDRLMGKGGWSVFQDAYTGAPILTQHPETLAQQTFIDP